MLLPLLYSNNHEVVKMKKETLEKLIKILSKVPLENWKEKGKCLYDEESRNLDAEGNHSFTTGIQDYVVEVGIVSRHMTYLDPIFGDHRSSSYKADFYLRIKDQNGICIEELHGERPRGPYDEESAMLYEKPEKLYIAIYAKMEKREEEERKRKECKEREQIKRSSKRFEDIVEGG